MLLQCVPCFLLCLLVLWSVSANHSSLGEELVPDPTIHGFVGQGRRVWQRPPPDPTNHSQSFLHGTFPPGFLWATGTSAQQSEGSWDSDGRGASIWDRYQSSDVTHDESSSSDSYVRWEDDVKALEFLGVRTYSFSLSWPRLFPDGNASGPPNAAAVEHYSRLLDRLLEQGIEPVVTLYHWDLPQALQDTYGGWRNDSLVALFDAYAAFCFRVYGGRVKHWLTMHNPALVAVHGYGTGLHAPGEAGGLSASLTAAHNLIRAHSKAWHTYNDYFRAAQQGAVSIALGSHWVQPREFTPDNVERCQESIEAVLGWFANPIFVDGDYPQSMRSRHGDLLPHFTPEEKHSVWGTADFFALSFGPNNLRVSENLGLYGQTVSPDLRSILSWVKMEYGDQKVLVAESGWFSESSVGTDDTLNMYLMKRFLNQVLQAITLDGVRVFGYTAWSLVDGYEWNHGYSVRRGLFYIDFSQPIRTRLPKTSALYYRRVVKDNGFPDNDETHHHIKGSFPCSFQWGVADSTLQVRFHPFSPQFTDPQLYSWNLTGDGSLRQVSGVKLQTRGPQCTDYLSIPARFRLLDATGATHYRFALNWSLILPQGDLSVVDTDVLRYYRCVLTELHKRGLEAVVTLYHPTLKAPHGLPAALHASGSWQNQSTVEAFLDYAELCYRELGPWVRRWITINEPNRVVEVYRQGEEQHHAAHNLLLAHARAWRLYESEFSGQQGALVSLALHADWAEPANPFLESHTAAAQRFLLFELGRFLDPLLGTAYEERGDKGGDYPPELRAYLEERALAMGLPGSPLPHFTETEKEEIRGTLGFIALNHFTTRLVSPYPSQPHGQQPPDHGCLLLKDPTWSTSGQRQALVPWGLRKVLGWVSERYGGALPVVVTASGVDDQALVEDRLRKYYIRSYLQEALKAVQLDGVNLQGFYVWRLQDEHLSHFRFGLFSSSHHQSKPKASVQALRELISHSGFPEGNATGRCHRPSEPQRQSSSCTFCAQILHNKPVLLLVACLLLCAVVIIIVTIVIFITSRRRNRKRGGGGRRMMMMMMTMKEEEALVRTLPPEAKRQMWDTRVTSPKVTQQKVMSQNLPPQKVTSQ